MSTPTDEVTLDIDALDAAAAGKGADKPNGAATDATVVVDQELADKTGGKEVLTPDAGLEKLKQQLKEEREATAAANQRAADASRAEAAARGDVQKSQLDLIKGAIDQTTQQLDVLESKYAEALSAQDFAAAAKVQREMSAKSSRLTQLENGKHALENAPKPQPRAPVDEVEQFASQLSAQSAAWVRANPDFVRNPQKNKRMLAAHSLALADGHQVDTAGYFRSIEETLKIAPAAAAAPAVARQVADEPEPTVDSAAVATGGRQAAPAAAPVTRSGNGANGSRPNTVKLSRDEVEMARNMFGDMKDKNGNPVDPLAEYARNKIALKKEGKLQ